MTDIKDDGGPAFPTDALKYDGNGQGMSLRDWYAGLCMQGMLDGLRNPLTEALEQKNQLADCAYQFADAMLKARK